ncbi:unnamed protein product [Ectocarpus sp. CCAP 1310/34]|nr:unnamed protein product [Ectocarpus sp. CCAP 1310/34]
MANPKELACRRPCCSSAAWCRGVMLTCPTKNRTSRHIFSNGILVRRHTSLTQLIEQQPSTQYPRSSTAPGDGII